MFAFLSNFFQNRKIEYASPIPLADCRIVRPYLLERSGIQDGTVIPFAVPYLSCAATDPARNLSAYAVPRDYHLFFRGLFDELIPRLCEEFPQNRFVGFADHSPIDEVDAAARAGLGIIGKNHLLITPRYASYVFLGEIVTDAHLPCRSQSPLACEACGSCMRQCPANTCGICLSALTQKKGELTEEERALIVAHGSVWGCDLCQSVCPHAKRAVADGTAFSPIPFFSDSPISHLTADELDAMSDVEFSQRAYAWRGRKTIQRNLLLMEKGDDKC